MKSKKKLVKIKYRIISLVCIFFVNCYTSSKPNTNAILALLNRRTQNNQMQITLVGDSLAERSNSFDLQKRLGASFKLNSYAISGRSSFDWLMDSNRLFQTPADIILIELGINDAYREYNFEEVYTRFINELESKFQAKFILATMPLTNEVSIQAKIKKNNESIRAKSNQYKISDLEKVFEDAKSTQVLFPPNDPIHPTSIGYELIGEKFKADILSR
jgi:lysophospholipase L1-like esterase